MNKVEIRHIEYSIKSDLTCIGNVGDFDFEKNKTKEDFKEDVLEYVKEYIGEIMEDYLKIEKVWYEESEV